MRVLLVIAQWSGDVTANVIYNERIAGDNCIYIHICSFEIFPAQSFVECAIKVTHADSEVFFYDATEGACSVCHPTSPDVYQLARGQRFYIRGKYFLSKSSVIFTNISIAPLLDAIKA